MQNTGYLPPNFWTNLWRLWPLVLVLLGIELLLRNHVPWPILAALAAVVLIVGAVASSSSWPGQASAPAYTTTAETQLQGASQAAVTVRFGAGQLNLGSINPPRAGTLASMTYQGPRQLAPEPRYSTSAGLGQLDYEATTHAAPPSFLPWVDGRSSDAARMDLNLEPDVPTSLAVQTGAADAHLDLSNLDVSTLDMSVGAATTWLRFPANAGSTTAHIRGGASTITLEIPQGVAAQIQYQGGVSTLNVDQSRFPSVSDSVFRSPDYDSATNKLDLTIATGVTTIQIN